MITFHPHQSDCVRRARKNENAGTINFTSQIASSICTVAFTKHEKSDATIFTSRCSRTAVSYRLRMGQALPLNFVRFSRLANRSTTNWRHPARRARDGCESSHKNSGEMSRPISRICRANAGRRQKQYCRISGRQLARQLASGHASVAQRPRRSPSNSRYNNPRIIPQDDCS